MATVTDMRSIRNSPPCFHTRANREHKHFSAVLVQANRVDSFAGVAAQYFALYAVLLTDNQGKVLGI